MDPKQYNVILGLLIAILVIVLAGAIAMCHMMHGDMREYDYERGDTRGNMRDYNYESGDRMYRGNVPTMMAPAVISPVDVTPGTPGLKK